MKSLGLNRHALAMGAASVLLAGCDGSQPPIAVPGTMPQSRAVAGHGDRRGSWMLPEAKGEDLIYAVGGCGGTCVLSYPEGTLVGELAYNGYADCSDNGGNVFISSQTGAVEFAHGGTSPIATYSVPYSPAVGCSVDPKTGDLSVVTGPYVAVFPPGSANPTTYNTLLDPHFCAYDTSGNLFVSGYDGTKPGLSELPDGSNAFFKLSVDKSVGLPGQVQWDGQYLAYESVSGGQPIISRLSISGSSTQLVGQIYLKRVPNRLAQSWIFKRSVLAPYSVTGPKAKNIGIWEYPQGGAPTKRIKSFGQFDKRTFGFSGVTVSVAPH